MEVISTLKGDILEPTLDSVKGIPSALTETFTSKAKATSVGWALGGLVGASVFGAAITMIPLQRLPAGNILRMIVTGSMGIGMMTVGSKDMSGSGSAFFVGGAILTGVAAGQVLGLVNDDQASRKWLLW